MTPALAADIRRRGYTAAHIAALCQFLSAALQADPDTATIGEAVEGLQEMARLLSDDLFTIAGDE